MYPSHADLCNAKTWTYATIELWDGITGSWYEYHTLPTEQEAKDFMLDNTVSHPESLKCRIVTTVEYS